MEVDTQSSVLPVIHPFSSKRPRSPDSPVDRTSKRLSLAADVSHTSVFRNSGFRCHQDTSNVRAGRPAWRSDDWVQQAGGLSIDGPVIQSGTPFQSSPGKLPTFDAGMSVEENMATDERDISQVDVQSFTSVPDVQASSRLFVPISREGQSLYAGRQQQLRTKQSVQVLTDAPPISSRQLHPPTIIIQPSTPDDAVAQSLSTQIIPPETLQVNLTFPASMLVSPLPWSPTTIPSFVTARKQRLTMGPRADCEKCLQGVKGHWMHLD